MERQQAANSIKNLEAKLRELQEALMAKVRELGLAYNAHLPLDLELDAFATLLEAEERRWSFYPRFILIYMFFLSSEASMTVIKNTSYMLTWHMMTSCVSKKIDKKNCYWGNNKIQGPLSKVFSCPIKDMWLVQGLSLSLFLTLWYEWERTLGRVAFGINYELVSYQSPKLYMYILCGTSGKGHCEGLLLE